MTEVHPIEAHLIDTPYLVNRELHFSVKPNDRGDDMDSICGRCNLELWCFGIINPRRNRKDARINLDVPGIKKITSSDTSNCGIITDIMAKKNEVQSGFFPKLGYLPTT